MAWGHVFTPPCWLGRAPWKAHSLAIWHLTTWHTAVIPARLMGHSFCVVRIAQNTLLPILALAQQPMYEARTVVILRIHWNVVKDNVTISPTALAQAYRALLHFSLFH